jgi:hypothetical protein
VSVITAIGQNFHCSLPIVYQDPSTSAYKVSFLRFPDGTLMPDSSGLPQAGFYDRAYRKWLPVPVTRDDVSPDGARYAYSVADFEYHKGGTALHVVNVATGADTVVYTIQSGAYKVVDYAPEGLYISAGDAEGRNHGLWIYRFDAQPPRLINGSIDSPAIGIGSAWGLDFDTADTNNPIGGLQGPLNRVLQINLTTGAATVWLYRPGRNVGIMGVDTSGDPMASVYTQNVNAADPGSTETLLLKSPTVAETLLVASDADPQPVNLAAIDAHGVWLDGRFGQNYEAAGSVWLYAGGALQLVATTSGWTFYVAGGCIP